MVDNAGDVADGEIITTPFAVATFCKTAVVTPEQSAPMIATTLSLVISRSAVAVAAAASTQVESPRTDSIVEPPMNLPLFDASAIAISAPAAISGVNDSIGPVKPSKTPIFTDPPSTTSFFCVAINAAAKPSTTTRPPIKYLFICSSLNNCSFVMH